jgi:DNA-directed RNA polymerase subunit RPC12/RpoP
MSETENNDKKSIFKDLLGDFWPESKKKPLENSEDKDIQREKPATRPSLETIGMTDCSVCKAEVSVVLTRTGHPFTACGKCGARTFFNSRVAIDILQRQMRSV